MVTKHVTHHYVDSDNSGDGQEVPDKQAASVHLPASLFRQISDRYSVGLLFALYDTAILFPVDDNSTENGMTKQSKIGSRVLAAAVSPEMIFVEPVTVMLSLEVDRVRLYTVSPPLPPLVV